MTGEQIQTMFEGIVDDTMDDIQFLLFLNAAKNQIESMRDWNFNRAIDSSKTVPSGSTYLTSIALPTGLLAPRKVYFHGDRQALILIGLEERERYQDAYKRYYIDWLNRTFSVCGAGSIAGRQIDFFYARQTDDITLVSSPVWPDAFHPLLAFKVAEMWSSGSDADDLNFRMSRENLRLYNDLWKAMVSWDSKIKTMEYNDRNVSNIDVSSYPNVVDLNY